MHFTRISNIRAHTTTAAGLSLEITIASVGKEKQTRHFELYLYKALEFRKLFHRKECRLT